MHAYLIRAIALNSSCDSTHTPRTAKRDHLQIPVWIAIPIDRSTTLDNPVIFPTSPPSTIKMSDSGEVQAVQLPKEIAHLDNQPVLLFGKWSYEDVEIRDISLT